MRFVHGGLRSSVFLCLALLATCLRGQTIVGVATPLAQPNDTVYDTRGNLYFSETNRHQVRRLDPSGAVTTVAGTGVQGFGGDGGAAVLAQLDSPCGLAVDAAGNLYIADSHNQRVRRVDAASGQITTAAGRGARGFAGDGGAAAAAALNGPDGLAVDAGGNLFIADSGNHRVRRVKASDGTISTIAGDGVQGFAGDGGSAVSASLHVPSGLAVDAAGNLYLADREDHRVRVVSGSTGSISTLAGNGSPGTAGLSRPGAVVVDRAGTVYVADVNNHRVRLLAGQATKTVAGNGVEAFAGDGGPAVSASFDAPRGVTLSGAGLVTIADTENGRVRQVAADGTVSTLVGAGAVAPADFTLAVSGASQQTVPAGGTASFPFAVQMEGGTLASPIALTAGALPAGITVSFSPATLSLTGGSTSFTLTVQTSKTLAALRWGLLTGAVTALLLPWGRFRRGAVCSLGLLLMVGCGFQATVVSNTVKAAKGYPLTISGTAKASSGALVVHTATVTVYVQ